MLKMTTKMSVIENCIEWDNTEERISDLQNTVTDTIH